MEKPMFCVNTITAWYTLSDAFLWALQPFQYSV